MVMAMIKSLKDLVRLKIESREQSRDKSASEAAVPETTSSSDSELFYSAMSQVKPLKSKGRDIPVEVQVQDESTAESDEVLQTLYRLINGEIEFDIHFSEEYVQGFVQGINSKTFRRLRNGELSIQAHVDLHGFNSEQARAELLCFIREQYIHNKKCVLVIPGRGKNSPQGAGVLRNEIQNWLTQDPLKRIVLAFCSALPRHGGTGALYVLLRGYKKNKGKVFWDKYLLDPDS